MNGLYAFNKCNRFNTNTLRKSINLKQNKLALNLDLSPNYIGKIARNEKIPSLKTLVSFANFFNVSVSDLTKSEIILEDTNIYIRWLKEYILTRRDNN